MVSKIDDLVAEVEKKESSRREKAQGSFSPMENAYKQYPPNTLLNSDINA